MRDHHRGLAQGREAFLAPQPRLAGACLLELARHGVEACGELDRLLVACFRNALREIAGRHGTHALRQGTQRLHEPRRDEGARENEDERAEQKHHPEETQLLVRAVETFLAADPAEHEAGQGTILILQPADRCEEELTGRIVEKDRIILGGKPLQDHFRRHGRKVRGLVELDRLVAAHGEEIELQGRDGLEAREARRIERIAEEEIEVSGARGKLDRGAGDQHRIAVEGAGEDRARRTGRQNSSPG